MASVFLVDEETNTLCSMKETPFEKELVLQDLLTKYPNLIPGDELDEESPRRWLLVSDEMGIPDNDGGGDRWSLDHLFLDQDGVPTYIECKRASDTRIRREVVAQMLDYAANGTAYWSIERIREKAAENAKARGKSLDEVVAELLGGAEAEQVDAYWKLVETKLRKGQVRLVFVADEIPRELRRLVEFLNERMQDVSAVAVEIKQYLGDGRRAVVPRVIGLTEQAKATKQASGSGGGKKAISPEDFYAACEPAARAAFQRIEAAAQEAGHLVTWYTTSFSVRASVRGALPITFFRCHHDESYFCYAPYLPLSTGELGELRALVEIFDVTHPGGGTKASGPDLEGYVTEENADAVVKMFDSLARRVQSLATPPP
jgi:ribosomal protein L7Ae-like RNA K-turn-binding protein